MDTWPRSIDEDGFFFLGQEQRLDQLIGDLEQFVVADDVEFSDQNDSFVFSFRPIEGDKNYRGVLFGHEVCVCLGKGLQSDELFDQEDPVWKKEVFFTDMPTWGVDLFADQIINETFLNKSAISYDKGCFLGQETAAKIETRRGAARLPCPS